MVLKRLHQTISYEGAEWYYSGKSLSTKYGITYTYCNHPVTKNNNIYARTNKIKFIHFRFKMRLLKVKSKEQKAKDQYNNIFNQISSYRKKHGIKVSE